MKVSEFRNKLKKRRIFIIPKSKAYHLFLLLERVKELKVITKYIEFGCKFNDKGRCNGKRTSYKDALQCCCVDCKHKIGYLDLVYESDIGYYAEKYNEKTGFWRKGKGCILDREKRSAICVTYVCGVAPDELKRSLESLERSIRDSENKIRDREYVFP